MAAASPYIAPISLANPYLTQAASAENQAGLNSYNAWNGVQQGQTNLQALQQQQTQLLGNGAYGYEAGGGNDTGTGGYFNPWSTIQVQNAGQASNPNLPNYNPNTSNLGGAPGYALSGYAPAYSSSYINTSFLPDPSTLENDPTGAAYNPGTPGTPAIPATPDSGFFNSVPGTNAVLATPGTPATGDPNSFLTAENSFLAANPGANLNDPTANFMGGNQPTGYAATGNATAGTGAAASMPASATSSAASSSYPTYPNSAGVGTQNASAVTTPQAPTAPSVGSPTVLQQTGAVSNPGMSTQQQAQTQVQANTTQGMNPWSLTGEANSRVM